MALTVLENQLGYAAAPGDLSRLATSIRQLAADPIARARFAGAAASYATRHNAAAALARWTAVLDELGACGPEGVADKLPSTR